MRFLTFVFLALCALAPSGFAQAPLRPGDSFDLQLSGMPIEYAQEFRAQYTVADDGTVSIPLVNGPVRAAGLSPSQLARAIEKKLVTDKIFTTPTVQLVMAERSRTVTVGGAVRAPQELRWSPDLTLSAAIKRAGGIGDFGSSKKVRITRDGKVGTFNLNLAGKDPSQNPKLLPGDEVEVPE